MIKVLFICHGNICRSPMAEYLFKKMVADKGLEDSFQIISRATSSEEIGNGIHYGTKRILDSFGIDSKAHRARRITLDEYRSYDYIIAMDRNNLYNMRVMFDDISKVSLLLNYAGINRDISDPWYTGDFNKTYDDIMLGLDGFYNYLKEANKI